MKKLFLALPIFLMIASLAFGFLFNIALAATGYTPLAPLPGMKADTAVKPIDYLSYLYTFGITLAGMLAVIVIVIGGIQYMTAAGNASKVTEAKERIWNAIWGLLLVLVSYMILEIINPDLVNWSNSFFV